MMISQRMWVRLNLGCRSKEDMKEINIDSISNRQLAKDVFDGPAGTAFPR